VTTEVCVQTTMREANDRGYECLLVEDATESYFAAFKQATLDMVLFVVFFPQLVAGPIVHHSEMMPQFTALRQDGPDARIVAEGLVFFVLGLSKKVLLADPLAGMADPAFAQAAVGEVTAAAAWVGALAYSLQLHFDFSGYSDMAVGLSRMFGIRLPHNFASP